MSAKKTIQVTITGVALLLSICHVVWPSIKIDVITVTLLVVASFPWLELLFKTVEFSGLKVEYKDLEKVSTEAAKAGLITERAFFTDRLDSGVDDRNTLIDISTTRYDTNNEGYGFIEIAAFDQGLALAWLRMEIEKRLRQLAKKYGVDTQSSITKLISVLSAKHILTIQEQTALKDMIHILNQAVHGIEYDQRNATWIIEYGPKILDSLDDKLEIRGGRFSVGNNTQRQHWIDKSFKNCHWETNSEWIECIDTHLKLWEEEMENLYNVLLKKLSDIQREKLIEVQNGWQKQFELEKDFWIMLKDKQQYVGREGQIISSQTFMEKVRERVLEIEEILNHL